MSVRGRPSRGLSSSGNRGNSPCGRKRKLSSRSLTTSNSHSTLSHNSRITSSSPINDRDSLNHNTNRSPATKKGRLSSSAGSSGQSTIVSSSLNSETSSLTPSSQFLDRGGPSGCTEWCSYSQSDESLESESDMAQVPLSQSPFGNNFLKSGGVNNHRRPGQGKKLVIKNRKGKRVSNTLECLKFCV